MLVPRLAPILAIPLLFGCSTTQLVSERVGPAELASTLRTVIVVGVSDDVDQRVRLEKAFTVALEKQAAIAATPATSLVPPEQSLEREVLRDALQGADYDGILLVRKLGERADVSTARIGTGIPDVEASAYDDFHGRYVNTIGTNPTESATRVVRAEVTLLRPGDFAEVWTAVTDSQDPRELDPVADEIAAITIERLRAHRLL